jgi:hypothetical protein
MSNDCNSPATTAGSGKLIPSTSAAQLGTTCMPPITGTITLRKTDGASPTPLLFCTDDEDQTLAARAHRRAYSVRAKQAPEWVVDAVNEYSYHLKNGNYRTVGSFKVFFQNDLKAWTGTGEDSSGVGGMIRNNGATPSFILVAGAAHSFMPARKRGVALGYGILILSTLWTFQLCNGFDVTVVCKYNLPSLLSNCTESNHHSISSITPVNSIPPHTSLLKIASHPPSLTIISTKATC